MKIVVPTDNRKGLDDTIAEHFGRCKTYSFFNEKGKVIEIIDNIREQAVLPPELIKKHGADVLLCQGLGLKALHLCKKIGIDVYIYQTKSVKEIFKMWQDNKIKKADIEDVCGQI